MDSMPAWVLSARKFAATGKHEFLAQAADACGEAEIQAFLLRKE
jgi:hypothetical protein